MMLILVLVGTPTFQFYPPLVKAVDPTYSVTIIDYAFQPLHINITTGTTVVWTYTDTGKDLHTVTSDPGTNKTQSGAPLLNSGSLSPGQGFSYVFNQPGHYPYQCSYHPNLMNGWVNVTGAPVGPTNSQNPQTDYTLLYVAVGVAAVAIVGTLVLFVRKNRKASPATTAA
jgi:plastocyanin